MHKTLITSVVYFKPDLVKEHVNFLTTVSDKSDIIILENPSPNTIDISNHCINLVNQNKLYKYLLFDNNIGMNTFETLFNTPDIVNLDDYSYVIITDGDLTVKDPNWLEEQIYILEKYPDTYACGVKLSLENLPTDLKKFPDVNYWVPGPTKVTDDYETGVTGLHLLMYKKDVLKKFIDYIRKNSLNCMDVVMNEFCNQHTDLCWRRTRKAEAYHMTWDEYQKPGDDYLQIKLTKTQEEMWYHKKTCRFSVFEKGKSYRHQLYIKV